MPTHNRGAGTSRRVASKGGGGGQLDSRKDSGESSYTSLQGVGRAMAVLNALAESPMTATDVMEALGLKWATTYRTLAYLEDNGYLRRDPATAVYYIGPRLYHIGSSYVANLPILQAARPYLKSAVDETGATVQLVERDGFQSVALVAFEPRTDYLPRTSIGYHQPLHCGSRGYVLLAHAEPEFVDEYLSQPLAALTPYTLTDPDELRRALENVRQTGFAATRRDVQLFTASVGCPVWDASGAVVAAITLIVNYSQFDELEARLTEVASEVAQSVSVATGWRPPSGGGHGRPASQPRVSRRRT